MDAKNRRMLIRMITSPMLHKPGRTLSACIASFVGALTLCTLAAVCINVPAQLQARMQTYGANLIVSGRSLPTETVDAVTAYVQSQSEHVLESSVRYETVRINSAAYIMAGIDPAKTRAMNGHWSVEGNWPKAGEILLGADVANKLSATVGSTVTVGFVDPAKQSEQNVRDGRVSTDILTQSGSKLRVSGVVTTGGNEDGIIFANPQTLDNALGKRGSDVLEFSTQSNPETMNRIVEKLNSGSVAQGVNAQQVSRMNESNTRIITMLRTLFWLISGVVLVLTMIGVSTTMASIVDSRRNEIGLRRALGAPSKQIALQLMLESSFYGLCGGALGAAAGFALAWLLSREVFDSQLPLSVPLIAITILVSVLVAAVAAIIPVKRALEVDPAVVLREE